MLYSMTHGHHKYKPIIYIHIWISMNRGMMMPPHDSFVPLAALNNWFTPDVWERTWTKPFARLGRKTCTTYCCPRDAAPWWQSVFLFSHVLSWLVGAGTGISFTQRVFEAGIFHGHSSEGICIFGSFKALKLRYLSPDHGKACAIAGEGVTDPPMHL